MGIPEKKCPPTFYELLGISLNEEDRAVIQSAAERQKTHIEQYLGTPYNKFANQLISQIDEAEITLLSPQLRREYDRQVDLFKKRRKKRQFDPTVISSQIPMRGNRTVGEESGLAREYAGIVSVLAIAFFGMAAGLLWQLPGQGCIRSNRRRTWHGTAGRGGSATNTAGFCGSAFRFNHPPPETRQARLGFRVVRSSVQQTAGK